MRFRRKILREITERLNQFGLTECPVCKAENSLHAHRRPVILSIGGSPIERGKAGHDPEANVLFMLAVVCDLCGYFLLFDSEKHHGPDEPVLFQGSQELEDEIDPEPEA
jgi:hypothetical protein